MDAALVLLLVVMAIPSVIPDAETSASSLELQNMYYQKFIERYQMNATSDELAADTSTIRKKTFFRDPNDPLHAYPDAQDEFIHDLFQTITVYEINNSEKIRKGVDVASALGLASVVALGLRVFSALTTFAFSANGRSWQDHTSTDELVQLTSTILESIQRLHFKHHS